MYEKKMELFIAKIIASFALTSLLLWIYRRFLMAPLIAILMKSVHSIVEDIKKKLFEKAIANIESIQKNRRVEVLGLK